MKKSIFIVAAVFSVIPATGQETYENAKLVNEDLNGTARYVGMGGAMEALGADISTINTNPAGIGMFRHSTVNGSFGFVSQHDGKNFEKGKQTNMSFDQLGFVYTMRTGQKSFLNFGFNYHKSKNFDEVLSAVGSLEGASQNKLTYEKYKHRVFSKSTTGSGIYNSNDYSYNQLDAMYMNNLMYNQSTQKFYYINADGYTFDRANTGYIGEYDFNISGNINDRVYLGLTAGIHDVHYRGFSSYVENVNNRGSLAVSDLRKITGTGFDVKFGAIFRPIESSPFRIGLYIQTPTWYNLTTSNSTEINGAFTYTEQNNSSNINCNAGMSESYDFKFYTPWKFGVSLGHTIGNYLALGATYEYSDYSSCDMRYNTGSSYDYYSDTYYDNSSSDRAMNDHISKTLKGVSTVKLGIEYKPDPSLAVRLGYNYVSPVFNINGYKDGTLDSPGSYYSSATDYTNWKSTNRITCGVGYKIANWNFDLAYQYSQTNGEFYPFMSYYQNTNLGDTKDDNNICDAVKVSNKRSQVLFTLGYTF